MQNFTETTEKNSDGGSQFDELSDLENQILDKVQKCRENIQGDLSQKNAMTVRLNLNEIEFNAKRNIVLLGQTKDVCEGKTNQVTEIKNVTDIWSAVN